MTTDKKIRDEKLQYDFSRDKGITKGITLPSGKTDKYEYLTGGEKLFSDQSKMTEQA